MTELEQLQALARYKTERRVAAMRAPIHTFGCGCQADDATGFPITTCKRHDQRLNFVKAAAALMQMGNALDETGDKLAAKYAVKAAKALIGADTE